MTTSPRYVVHSTGPKTHYVMEAATKTFIGLPFRTKRMAELTVRDKNEGRLDIVR